MVINPQRLRCYEQAHGRLLPKELKRYLLVHYSNEPFPYGFSQQDLDEHIRRAIQTYENGTLDVSIQTASESWQEEMECLRRQCIETRRLARQLADYLMKLEQWLHQHGLELPPSATRHSEHTSNEF